MSTLIHDSNVRAVQAVDVVMRGAPAAARRRRFRVDELLHEIGWRGRLWFRVAPLVWGAGGFLIGATFWHLIGVWGFLGTVVLKGPEVPVSIVARQQMVQPATLPNCTVLVLDRLTGLTSSVPCPEHLPLLEEARSHRQDLALAQTR
jgi:hypothetical protein